VDEHPPGVVEAYAAGVTRERRKAWRDLREEVNEMLGAIGAGNSVLAELCAREAVRAARRVEAAIELDEAVREELKVKKTLGN